MKNTMHRNIAVKMTTTPTTPEMVPPIMIATPPLEETTPIGGVESYHDL